MIKGMEHVGLCAEDPKTLVEWYVRILGFRIVPSLEEHNTYFIRVHDGGMLEVYPAEYSGELMGNCTRFMYETTRLSHNWHARCSGNA